MPAYSGSRNDPCTKRPQYHYTRYTPSSAAGLSLILRMDRSTSAMIRLLTRGDQLVDPLSGVQRRPVRHPAQSVGQLDQRIRRPGRLREYHPRWARGTGCTHSRRQRSGDHQARVTRLVAADVPPLNAFPIILRRVRLDRDGKCQWVCIGGEKRLDSVQPSNCMGNGPAMRASVLLSLTGKDGNDGNLHREDDFRFHTSVQRWTDDIP